MLETDLPKEEQDASYKNHIIKGGTGDERPNRMIDDH